MKPVQRPQFIPQLLTDLLPRPAAEIALLHDELEDRIANLTDDPHEQRRLNEYVLENNLPFNWGTLIEKGRFPSDLFDNQKDVEFEGRSYLGTSDPAQSLKLRFGDDYMTPPPESDRIAHHYLRCYIND